MRGLRLLIGKARHTHTQTAASFSSSVAGILLSLYTQNLSLVFSLLAIFVDVVLRSAAFT